ncbi:N-acetylmuramoyl-L-alanine amidase [Psychroserpens sp.]|uniref:N-acetylmuramoyl-L-alanine amidase family protein n=1 Tax=Psychroserpens sp. TaxID=2020870 RepID=UPI001B122A65|nr:N-acetylmuramoyl-L-alanine amidase [Psychroserpens sp.]MBO6606374.1 N-acetylmuramoyl-L-alanine amidase [Psychroserpens sp.]MBO6632327.1 N-acetylmuramoyl-L-alanine amidase [Psychroserpens sp.]MBO6653078.1 N-acetylmuramoyl-L-alanine amidase [Psychroserpens sp.]MBO6680894.1 N-acetylmuramoyl-L-alanine amidase [Psychroserpens sp.]MBO6750148.1 N-acetylmuramoyl-L-alanine amidase [Psychroserpens sp.]
MKTTFLYILVFASCLFTSILTPVNALQNGSDKFVVVLDAGHGGKDPGRPTKYGYKEKNIALKLVLAVGAELEKNEDIKVIYTRKSDKFLQLYERAAIANKADADLFISIHCNAHNSQAYGTETYVLATRANNKNIEIAKRENEVIFLESNYERNYEGFDPNSPESLISLNLLQEEYLDQSIQLARNIEDNFKIDIKRKSRGVKQAGFWVLHNTYMPSVLIETGFITNKKEGDYLNSKKGQRDITKSIVKAIKEYKKELELNIGVDVYQPDNSEAIVIDDPQIIKNVVFKVQIAASSKGIEPKPYNFKGLSDISREKVGSMFRYYYGYTSDYSEIKQLQENAKTKGYSDCFVVAFRDGKKIDVSEALKSTSN